MQKSVFEAKSKQMNDFYMYYKRKGRDTFSVATSDFSSPYIKKKGLKQRAFNPETHVQVWDWKADRFITVRLEDITKLVPLNTVLKNGRT